MADHDKAVWFTDEQDPLFYLALERPGSSFFGFLPTIKHLDGKQKIKAIVKNCLSKA